MKSVVRFILLFILIISVKSIAHEQVLEPDCEKPKRLRGQESSIGYEYYQAQLADYQQCLQRFLELRQAELVAHDRVIYRALKAWKSADLEAAGFK